MYAFTLKTLIEVPLCDINCFRYLGYNSGQKDKIPEEFEKLKLRSQLRVCQYLEGEDRRRKQQRS